MFVKRYRGKCEVVCIPRQSPGRMIRTSCLYQGSPGGGNRSFSLASRTIAVAASNSLKAVHSNTSGANNPTNTQITFLRKLRYDPSPGGGILTCTALETQKTSVLRQAVIISDVPRTFESDSHVILAEREYVLGLCGRDKDKMQVDDMPVDAIPRGQYLLPTP